MNDNDTTLDLVELLSQPMGVKLIDAWGLENALDIDIDLDYYDKRAQFSPDLR